MRMRSCLLSQKATNDISSALHLSIQTNKETYSRRLQKRSSENFVNKTVLPCLFMEAGVNHKKQIIWKKTK